MISNYNIIELEYIYRIKQLAGDEMKNFFKAKIEIIPFDEEDIVTESTGSGESAKDPDMDESGWHLFG